MALRLELLQRYMAKLGGRSIEDEDIPVLEAHGSGLGCLLSNITAGVANMVGEQWRTWSIEWNSAGQSCVVYERGRREEMDRSTWQPRGPA